MALSAGVLYVADFFNHRVMRWRKGATEGSGIIGGNGQDNQSNQLNGPIDLSFDRQGNLYVVDYWNNRMQKFEIDLD
jgi:sugar lactone lactonase YvrE